MLFTVGASSLGSVFRETNDLESSTVVHHAIKSGINYIDVAPWYGHGKAETVLGKVITPFMQYSDPFQVILSPSCNYWELLLCLPIGVEVSILDFPTKDCRDGDPMLFQLHLVAYPARRGPFNLPLKGLCSQGTCCVVSLEKKPCSTICVSTQVKRLYWRYPAVHVLRLT